MCVPFPPRLRSFHSICSDIPVCYAMLSVLRRFHLHIAFLFLSREKLVAHHEGVLSQAQPVYLLHCTTPNATAVEEEPQAEWHVLLREQLKFPRWVFMGQEISCFGRIPYDEHLALANRMSVGRDFCGILSILRRYRWVQRKGIIFVYIPKMSP